LPMLEANAEAYETDPPRMYLFSNKSWETCPTDKRSYLLLVSATHQELD